MWHTDGPKLPIEFARQSRDGRLTLVIYPKANPVPTLWALFPQASLDQAVEILRKRESTLTSKIGFLQKAGGQLNTQFPFVIEPIRAWLNAQPFEVVIWTDLEAKGFQNYNETTVLDYLWHTADREKTREYIARAPSQIDTTMRKVIADSGFLNS